MTEHLDAIGINSAYKKEMKLCEVCDSDEQVLLQSRGRIAEAGVYGELPVYICQRCGYIMQNPRYEDQFYLDYYEKLYREVTFGHTAPNQSDIDEQIYRAEGVMKYIHEFIKPPASMLDHGCAAGGTMLPFRDAGWECYGVDPHKPSVETGCEHLKLDIRVGSGEALPFEDNFCDLIFSLGSTEHSYDFGKMMHECRRVLKPGGWMLIRWRSNTLWGSPMEYYNHNHYRFFTPDTWKLALLRYGFEVIDATDEELEHKPGEVYIMAQANREPSLDAVLTAIENGEGDDYLQVIENLNNYRDQFLNRCKAFLNFCNKHQADYSYIANAARSNEIDYRILLGDDEWAVNRAISEAELYIKEYESGQVI